MKIIEADGLPPVGCLVFLESGFPCRMWQHDTDGRLVLEAFTFTPPTSWVVARVVGCTMPAYTYLDALPHINDHSISLLDRQFPPPLRLLVCLEDVTFFIKDEEIADG